VVLKNCQSSGKYGPKTQLASHKMQKQINEKTEDKIR
jgi:hypothetical protein